MEIAHSRLTGQGQISVPVAVRHKLGIGPGGVLEWSEENGVVTVRRAGRHSSEEIHQAVFPAKPKKRSLAELKAGLKKSVAQRHARD
ncbi:MAG: AbrB/MazE/SpoVT family DNA-binding domain-containing protein [Vicinamibacteria bacterium]